MKINIRKIKNKVKSKVKLKESEARDHCHYTEEYRGATHIIYTI